MTDRPLTVREEFVKAAMQGILASTSTAGAFPPETVSKRAIEHADAVLEALADDPE